MKKERKDEFNKLLTVQRKEANIGPERFSVTAHQYRSHRR